MDLMALKSLVFAKYGLHFTPTNNGKHQELLSPKDGRSFAILSEERPESLDVKCPNFARTIQKLPHFESANYINDPDWIGVNLVDVTDTELGNVLDYAFKGAANSGKQITAQRYIYLSGDQDNGQYHSQPIKLHPSNHKAMTEYSDVPKQIQLMIKSYDYTVLPMDELAYNFFHQGMMVADYTDSYKEKVACRHDYPVYHTMTINQLRTYFTWRTGVREGDITDTWPSYVKLYTYELLNGIGSKNPDEAFQKLWDFNEKNLDGLNHYEINQWLKEMVLYYGLDRDKANSVFDEELKRDKEYHILLHPDDYDDNELVAVFDRLGTYQDTVLLKKRDLERYGKVLKAIWKELINFQPDNQAGFFKQNVATQVLQSSNFFSGAVFYFKEDPKFKEYPVDSERKYQFKDRKYYCQALVPVSNQRTKINTFLHELDRLTRIAFHLGRPLKPRKMDQIFVEMIKKGIVRYQKQESVANRPKININLKDLDQIRADASVTRESLLTEEEKEETTDTNLIKPGQTRNENSGQLSLVEGSHNDGEVQPDSDGFGQNQDVPTSDNSVTVNNEVSGVSLDDDEHFFLLALLKDQPWKDYLKKHHLMASILADQINEKMFDVIGDDVIEFDNHDQPQIIEDYQEDLEKIFLKKE